MRMLIRKAYKFKLKPDRATLKKLNQISGACRFLWNKSLSMNLERLEKKYLLVWYNELAFWLTFWKRTEQHSFLKECPSQSLQQVLKQQIRAFKDGFDKNQPLKRLPTFKKKGLHDSFCYPQGFKIVNRRMFLPKLGWVGFHKSRAIEGIAKNITISRDGDGWYASVQVEVEVAKSVHSSTSAVGIDMGVARMATLSDGTYFAPKNSFRKHEKQLAKEQQRLSRKIKFSNGWKRQKRRIARVHQKIRNCRHDFLHWVTSKISKSHAIVVLEALKIKNMSRSAKGSFEAPGINVKAKSGLNKSILDQGWGLFKQMLNYKQQWAGGEVVFVDPRYTSQRCPRCSKIDAENRKSQAEFECTACAYSSHADVVAAKNILAAGLAAIACQANRNSSRQQEPVGNREVCLPCAG